MGIIGVVKGRKWFHPWKTKIYPRIFIPGKFNSSPEKSFHPRKSKFYPRIRKKFPRKRTIYPRKRTIYPRKEYFNPTFLSPILFKVILIHCFDAVIILYEWPRFILKNFNNIWLFLYGKKITNTKKNTEKNTEIKFRIRNLVYLNNKQTKILLNWYDFLNLFIGVKELF